AGEGGAVGGGDPEIVAVLAAAEGDARAVGGDGSLVDRHAGRLLDAEVHVVPIVLAFLRLGRPGDARLGQRQDIGAEHVALALADEGELVAPFAPGDAGVVGGEAGDVAGGLLGGRAG